jgi:hypothetical protein
MVHSGDMLRFVKAKQLVGRPTRAVLRRLGYEVHRRDGAELFPVDYDQATIELFQHVEPFTLTSHERIHALRAAVRYLVEAGVEGAFLECGVWRGGSMLAVARTLVSMGAVDRDLYLFDTFTTMPPPGEEDVDVWGNRAADFYDEALAHPGFSYLPMERVRELLVRTGYPDERLHFVAGLVEDTIPDHAPDQIALCRLDTDWYESTQHEMEHLFPRIAEGGVLIVDDYGQFMGAKHAVDEYLDSIGNGVLLNRIDFTGRLAVVTADVRSRALHRSRLGHARPRRARVATIEPSPTT